MDQNTTFYCLSWHCFYCNSRQSFVLLTTSIPIPYHHCHHHQSPTIRKNFPHICNFPRAAECALLLHFGTGWWLSWRWRWWWWWWWWWWWHFLTSLPSITSHHIIRRSFLPKAKGIRNRKREREEKIPNSPFTF